MHCLLAPPHARDDCKDAGADADADARWRRGQRGARTPRVRKHSWIQEGHIPEERHIAAFHKTLRRCPSTSTVPVPENLIFLNYWCVLYEVLLTFVCHCYVILYTL